MQHSRLPARNFSMRGRNIESVFRSYAQGYANFIFSDGKLATCDAKLKLTTCDC